MYCGLQWQNVVCTMLGKKHTVIPPIAMSSYIVVHAVGRNLSMFLCVNSDNEVTSLHNSHLRALTSISLKDLPLFYETVERSWNILLSNGFLLD